MSRYFRNVSIREFYAGAIYMAAGDKESVPQAAVAQKRKRKA